MNTAINIPQIDEKNDQIGITADFLQYKRKQNIRKLIEIEKGDENN